jgi:hypothetical protein
MTDSGWRKRQIALDKKSENARELGLDYEPDKKVIEMAREAGFITLSINQDTWGPYLERFAELVRADERNSWPLEMEAMERQVNILTDALAKAKDDTEAHYKGVIDDVQKLFDDKRKAQTEQEPVAWRETYGKIIKALAGIVTLHTPDKLFDLDAIPRDPVMHLVQQIKAALDGYTPPQRKPLTLGQKQRLWSSVGDKPTLKDRVNAYGLAIEAAHHIKENT